MNFLKKYLVDLINFHRFGKNMYSNEYFKNTVELSRLENLKTPRRTHIINHLVSLIDAQYYLEIGARDPRKNFDRIQCHNKFTVDPGVEFEDNPVDFKMTSDVFFKKLAHNELKIKSNIRFDIIFIDGLHKSYQVEKDIINSLEFLNENGVIILHDCNPPSEFHQREQYDFDISPARSFWNGTTWKAFYKFRHRSDLFSICFDNDWGVGIISKKQYPFFNNINTDVQNYFYEFLVLDEFREEHLNLCSFEHWEESMNR